MNELLIENRTIGAEHAPFVIAEIGVNHDGSLARARQLVFAAADAGADAVKLQIFRAEQLMHPSALMADYQRSSVKDSDPLKMLRRLELADDALLELKRLIRSCGMIPMATPFSVEDVDAIRKLDLPVVKIASPDVVNFPLLSAAMELNVPMIVSTGAATLDEVDQAARWLRDGGAKFSFMHCTSNYPVANADANLSWIGELARRYEVPIGFSDHTMSPMAGAFAVAAGATLLEKHLTYSRSAAGPDHSASAEPQQFRQYVDAAREAATFRGTGSKRVLECELDVRNVSRQSLVTTRELRVGERIDRADLKVQRPGTGTSAADYERVIGSIAQQPIPANTILQWDMLGHAA